MPISGVRTRGAQIASTLSQERLFALLTVGFGLLAVTLTCLGVYAIVANIVARRTAEVGVRMALGARPGAIVLMLSIGHGRPLQAMTDTEDIATPLDKPVRLSEAPWRAHWHVK